MDIRHTLERGSIKMIENYIEKDIMRQVKVTEYLFELKKIQIQDIARFLKVNKVTIKRDIEKILDIEPKIKVVFEDSTTIEVRFWKNATRYELIKKLYYQSHFLRVCSFYLLGETNYHKIVEKEHISVAKVFNLKKKVESFFINAGIINEAKEDLEDELKSRMIIIAIWMRIDIFNKRINTKSFYEAEQIVRVFIKEFSNKLNEREHHFFKLAIYLSLERHNKSLNLSKRLTKYIKKGFLYPKVKSLLANYKFNENEILYITMMFRLLNQNLRSYRYVAMDYEFLREKYINDIPEVRDLIHMFEVSFKRHLLKDIMFERPFIRFIVSTFLERQMFLVEKHYFLRERQQSLYPEIEKIMMEWSNKYALNIQLSRKTTEKFCLQVSELLLHDSSKNWNIFIVAEDEFSHILYREWIERKLNTNHIVINDELFYSLNDLPIYIDADNSIIVCERTLMNDPSGWIKESKTFPISLSSINEDLQKFLEYVFYS